LVNLVGAARFELATPCAQGGHWLSPKMPYFQVLWFQYDAGGMLSVVEGFGNRGFAHPQFHLHPVFWISAITSQPGTIRITWSMTSPTIIVCVSVYIFCDNSNIWIEGQWAAGRADFIISGRSRE
jgi:hypothetical protein